MRLTVMMPRSSCRRYVYLLRRLRVILCSSTTRIRVHLQANLDELIKRNAKPEQTPAATAQNPTTYSYVYLRVQPFSTTRALPQIAPGATIPASSSASTNPTNQSSLQFLISLSDPHHNLIHATVTQSVPGRWLDIWDEYDWVEDLMVEAIRIGVEIVGQEYIGQRMGWDGKKELVAVEQEPHAEKAAS